MEPIITSAQNENFKRFLALTAAKGLKEDELFLLSGEKLIREFLARPSLPLYAEIIPAQGTALTDQTVKKFALAPALFDALDVLGTHFNILVLEQPAIAALITEDLTNPTGIEVVAPVGDPGNLGALIRSCEAFGVARVILTREAAHPFLPKAVKASAGSVLRMPLARTGALADFNDEAIALDIDGIPLDEFVWPRQAFVVLGEEGPGYGARRFKTRVCIPTRGVESLNVVVAASIVLSRLPQE